MRAFPNVRFCRKSKCQFLGDSVEKLCVQSRFLCLIILAEHSGCLRSAHFTAIDVEFGHFPEVLGGSGEEELIIDAAGAT